MRVAQVAPLFESVPPRIYGGTERVVAYLVDELVAAGHDVTLFASGDSRGPATLVPLCERALRGTHPVDPMALHVRAIGEVCRRSADFDVIHFHVEYIHFPASNGHRRPHVTTLHNRLDIPELRPLYTTFSSEPLVSISDAQRRPIPDANWVATVPHGLPRDLLHAGRGRGEYLVYVGRMSPEKGPERAIALARATGMPLKMAAKVGWPDEDYFHAVVEPLIEQNRPLVEFLGEIGDREKDQLVGDAAALVFLIDWAEPFGLVMIESMACGTPVIAYPRGSVREIIEDGTTGFIVDDLPGAIAAVERLGTIDRAACRQEFETRFTSERMCRDYLRAYECLLP